MRLRIYVGLWLLLAAFLGREYAVLDHVLTGPSLARMLHSSGWLGREKLTTEPGAPLSFALGWVGFSCICLTNLYVLRKRLPALKDRGALANWLDFHIFCGLAGPTIIAFHSHFHAGGLVAVSYWSMMISFASGIAGRYLYLQILRQRGELKTALAGYEAGFQQLLELPNLKERRKEIGELMEKAYLFAGGSEAMAKGKATIFEVLFASLAGDVRLAVHGVPVPGGMRALRRPLKGYAVTRRRLVSAAYFRQLMGYWHTFHLPFAVFMYVVTVIHIAAALIFRVHH